MEMRNLTPVRDEVVIGIFHADVIHTDLQSKSLLPQRMDFLWVRWLGQDYSQLRHSGWKARRLMRVGFQDGSSSGAFGFLDPALVIRAVHLEPAFALGRTDEYLPPSIVRQPSNEDKLRQHVSVVSITNHGY